MFVSNVVVAFIHPGPGFCDGVSMVLIVDASEPNTIFSVANHS